MKYLLPVLAIIIFVLLASGAAFYFGMKSAGNNTSGINPTPTFIQSVSSQDPTPTSSSIQGKTISGGGVLVFSAYTLMLPEGWTSQREQGDGSDKLTLTKDGYTVTIAQVASEGVRCIYTGDADMEFSQKYSNFVEITNPNGFVFRRSSNESPATSWTVCQKGTDGSFGFPTSFGYTSLTTPSSPDPSVMAEIDSIFASFVKK